MTREFKLVPNEVMTAAETDSCVEWGWDQMELIKRREIDWNSTVSINKTAIANFSG